jgi:hypothetical protein
MQIKLLGDHHCGSRCNKSVTDQILYIHQILEKKWKYNGTVHQLFINFKEAYDSVMREVLCNILIRYGISRKLLGLIKMCLNESYSTVHMGKNLSYEVPIQNSLKQGDALSSQLDFGIYH